MSPAQQAFADYPLKESPVRLCALLCFLVLSVTCHHLKSQFNELLCCWYLPPPLENGSSLEPGTLSWVITLSSASGIGPVTSQVVSECVLNKCVSNSHSFNVCILHCPPGMCFIHLFLASSHLTAWHVLCLWYEMRSRDCCAWRRIFNIRDDLGDAPPPAAIHIYKMTQGTTPLLFHLEIQIAGSNLLDLSLSPYVQHLGVN